MLGRRCLSATPALPYDRTSRGHAPANGDRENFPNIIAAPEAGTNIKKGTVTISMPKKKQSYTEQSIVSLKGADRVRKRPSVIFGSDGLDGCEQSVFEIISNSVDEAREGFGDVITVTVFSDNAIEVDDRGRGVPLGYNEAEERLQLGTLCTASFHRPEASTGQQLWAEAAYRIFSRNERTRRVRDAVCFRVHGRVFV